jgi:hypothetical protein
MHFTIELFNSKNKLFIKIFILKFKILRLLLAKNDTKMEEINI